MLPSTDLLSTALEPKHHIYPHALHNWPTLAHFQPDSSDLRPHLLKPFYTIKHCFFFLVQFIFFIFFYFQTLSILFSLTVPHCFLLFFFLSRSLLVCFPCCLTLLSVADSRFPFPSFLRHFVNRGSCHFPTL
ncbi:uncharacterized protein SOCG_06307 [Schizosaccharomyces octosporus yFS286]|uniref:Uncharacterized protein n=1 Tax=Schizosaccharomyces octosporus (strain yFS286) TaxID=483514 RepID=S9PSW2_SCHOY|nr:uncharacterized protein SOCG_06307 [Schizosaccharomyces octosporus yFS286]EPX71052.1 hypothetical protein SOCG_06307 [Schizosaccharomyces octosporus yFS286]